MDTTDTRLNGTHRPAPRPTKAVRKAASKTRPKRRPTGRLRALSPQRRAALALGSVAAGLVALSVYHLTCGVAGLTGSPLVLAVLLAAGIDLGLVASEAAEMVAAGDPELRR